MKSKSVKLVMWPLAASLLFLLCSCSEKITDEYSITGESSISGKNGCLYSYICYNNVGKCDLDVTFNPDQTGTAEEIHYNSKYNVISVTHTAFTWAQKGDKVNLRGSRSVAYSDGDSSTNANWSGVFERVDGDWLPGTGFSSGFKDYYLQQKSEKNDKTRVNECISVTKTFNAATCQLNFKITNDLGKYYQTSAYQFGMYKKDYSSSNYSDEKGKLISITFVDPQMTMYLNSKKHLEEKGSSNWTSGERELYNSILKSISNFKSRVEKKNLGYVFVKLNGKEYVLLEF